MNAQAPHDFGAAVNIEAEQALLGALLNSNTAFASVHFLEAEHFSEPAHRRIFEKMRALIDAQRVASPITLRPFFPTDDMIDDMTMPQYLARLAADALPASFAREFGVGILESYAARKLAAACDDTAGHVLGRAPGESITSIIGQLEDELASIRALAPKGDVRSSLGAYLNGFLTKLWDQDQAARVTIPFPLPEIGAILQEEGFEPGNLYGLVGASGEGKTSLVLQIMRTAADAGHPVLLMSYDQTGEQVARQLISQATGISIGQLRSKRGLNTKEMELIDNERRVLERLPVEIRTLRQEKIGRICGQAQAFAKRWSRETDKAPLIILDHNRKVTPDRPNDHEGRIAGAINGAGKALAEEIGAAVLFLNQRNSGGARRDVPRPIVGDLFGGEQAREDYDSILYLYRPEHWQNEKLKVAGSASEEDKIRARFRIQGQDPEGKAELGALKVRYGRADVREIVNWEGRFTRYVSARSSAQELF